MPVERDTIFALSSGRPPAAIGVIRITGSRAGEALKALAGKLPEPRKAAYARVRDAQTQDPIDEALVLWFPAPHSETGEDIAELQLHGGRAVIAATLTTLGKLDGLRPAEPGEFTRRAFENGKLDLTAVEGLADLVMAETESQRRQALRQMQGALRDRAESWRERLIRALALIEARIDFSDEADVPQDLVGQALLIARELADEVEAALADGHRGERLREGLVVAIAGPPNAGKSTLLNRIARREAAIVSPFAGTTRDVIEVHLDLDGWPVTLLDTAGMRESNDPVEREGVRRARERAATADLVLWVVDTAAREAPSRFQADEAGQFAPGKTAWLIRNKIDVLAGSPRNELNDHNIRKNSIATFRKYESEFNISAETGEGLEPLCDAIARHTQDFLVGAESSLVTRERHRRAMEDALAALRRALKPELATRDDLLAEELRIAARALGRLTGRVDVEDILDVIFRDFCIGK